MLTHGGSEELSTFSSSSCSQRLARKGCGAPPLIYKPSYAAAVPQSPRAGSTETGDFTQARRRAVVNSPNGGGPELF